MKTSLHIKTSVPSESVIIYIKFLKSLRFIKLVFLS